jgi:hypothetical protein
MKLAHQFRAFLEAHDYLILPRLGKIETVTSEVNALTGEVEKRLLKFTGDTDIHPDADLINFISKNLKINSSIAISDLNSFCNSLKELLIQGFEAEIPEVGFLHMEPGNKLKFSGKSFYHPASLKHKKRAPAILHSTFWL